MQPPAEGLASRLFLVPALRTQPDRRLVAFVREGYETAFEEIVRRYGKPLSRYAASIVGNRSDDVLQDAFAKALPALRRDDAEIDLRPWLFRIVRNTALNDLRDRPPAPEALVESLVGGGGNPAEELERREELADLMRRLQALPEAQRAAIVMRELEGLSHEEIAAALGITGGGARQTIHRARRALRDGLGMLVPLPLLQSLLAAASTPGSAETATGVAGLGGAAGAGVGAGMALKATAATVLVAGTVGAGVALKPNDHGGDAEAAPAQVAQSLAAVGASVPIATGDGSGGNAEGEESGDRHDGPHDDGSHRGSGRGGAAGGEDHGGHGGSALGDDRGRAREPGDDHGGHGETGLGDDRGGRSGPSGHQGGSSEPGGEDRSGSGSGDRSGSSSGPGSGSGGSGSGGSGSGSNQGPGGGGEGSEEGGEPTLDDGSGVPGSGSDSSGSGSTPEPEPDHSGPG